MTPRSVAALAIVLCVYPIAARPQHPWQNEPLVSAEYSEPTARYPHWVLGDQIEYGALVLQYLPGRAEYTIRLPEERVFEDIKPRLVDVDNDGKREAMVVESHRDKGARLAIYNGGGLIAATPYIGTRFRWLAPIGAVDLDGDGHIEIAYIDRPHLAKVLRIWRFKDSSLTEITALPGLTNHRIGENFITGGTRNCGAGPELVVASTDWQNIVSVRYDDGWARETLSRFSPTAMDQAMACKL
ncbi:FG-GAP repeat domain-containing protein [Ruegeria halocynthiae]|uniref:FG-GAP repeat domain-containing protein n=1 Tax=Ruegeria halocynthiae TaxID=985054 RepID=UPI00056227A9|nr:VCBS repeat-containing protein [Ruegeria halocynthiae]